MEAFENDQNILWYFGAKGTINDIALLDVESAWIGATRFVPLTGDGYGYHYRIYIQIKASAAVKNAVAVQLDIQNKISSPFLDIALTEYGWTRNYYKGSDILIPINPDNTVDSLLAPLLQAGRHRYVFDSATGSGCRAWCADTVKLWETLGLMPEGSYDAVVERMDTAASTDPIGMPTPAPRGLYV